LNQPNFGGEAVLTQNISLQRRIDDAIAQHAMLKHPFYQLWSEGKLDQSVLQEYAKQYYAHVRAFPTYVSAVHSQCNDLELRQLLLENLIEEERGPENHPELWLRFAEGMGVSRDEVKAAALLPATTESVATFKNLTRSDDYRLGVAALYAYESQIPEVASTKRAGLKEFYGVEDARSTSFFTVHESADVIHRQTEISVLCDTCDTDESQDSVVAAASRAAEALWDFLTGVQTAYASAAVAAN
jgi:pyrroloquinoline-quinone synthase